MAAMIKMLGPTLKTATGEIATGEALKGKKAIGLYFSAHWCPPCRGFTPKLVAAYNGLKSSGKDFEIVFISSDRDEESFAEYFGEQPWLAIPFADRAAKAALSKKFKVNGIPALIILDEQGEILNKDGRSVIMEDPAGERFPWKPPTLWEALGEELINFDGDTEEVASIQEESDVIGIYFSAHWCPPCRGFTPQLCATTEKAREAGKKLSMIFVSSDRDQKSFREYLGEMPRSWVAIPPGDKRKGALDSMFEVEGIPRLVMIDAKTGAVINENARGAVGADPEGANFPWAPPAVLDLCSPDGINENSALCMMLDGCSSEKKAEVMAWLTPLAEELKASGEDLLVFAAPSPDGPVPQVRELMQLGKASAEPQLALLDIPDDGGYYKAEGPVTAESAREFVAGFKAGKLTRLQLQK